MKIREIFGLPFIFGGFIIMGIGLIISFGFKTFKEFSDKINTDFE